MMSVMNVSRASAKDGTSRDPPRQLNHHERDAEAPVILSIATLVIWLGCVAVGIGGFVLRYPRPSPPAKPLTPVQAQLLNVEITREPLPSPDVEPPAAPPDAALSQPPPPMPAEPRTAPSAPPLVGVATPNPAISFALPVEGPTRTVEPKRAAPVQPAPVAATAPVARQVAQPPADTPRQLVFGEGEGKQPAPEYPREAVIARQQGTVGLRFSVDADGRVSNAEIRSPCHAPLLNQAAARTVRENWRFAPGPPRTFDVSIEFNLKSR
jgi:protein TonB